MPLGKSRCLLTITLYIVCGTPGCPGCITIAPIIGSVQYTLWDTQSTAIWNMNIRIFNGCEVRIENSITRVTVWHNESCLAEWSRTVIPSDRVFNPYSFYFDAWICVILFILRWNNYIFDQEFFGSVRHLSTTSARGRLIPPGPGVRRKYPDRVKILNNGSSSTSLITGKSGSGGDLVTSCRKWTF